MKSLSLRSVVHFKIDGETPIVEDGNDIGSIVPDNDNPTITFERKSFKVYVATFTEVINENILVRDDDDKFQAFQEYMKPNTFKIFYSEEENILYSTAPTAISKSFFKKLENAYPAYVELKIIDFDFPNIIGLLTSTRGITFNTKDKGVQRKRFSGNAVDSNVEAEAAVDDDNATFLIGKMDVLNLERTLGFSKSSSILIYSSVADLKVEYPYLQLTSAIYDIIK